MSIVFNVEVPAAGLHLLNDEVVSLGIAPLGILDEGLNCPHDRLLLKPTVCPSRDPSSVVISITSNEPLTPQR
jgi:hypothetical protein